MSCFPETFDAKRLPERLLEMVTRENGVDSNFHMPHYFACSTTESEGLLSSLQMYPMAVLPEIFVIIHFNTSLPQHVNSFTVSKYQAKKKIIKTMKKKYITKGLSNYYYLVLTDMRVPQGDHEDFKFLGISNRQDFGHLGSSIDCIYPFFL